MKIGLMGCCSEPSTKNVRVSDPSQNDVSVPVGYYRVIGAVNKPCLVECADSEKSLMSVITEAGGLKPTAYRKKIDVSCAGTTNYYNANKINSGEIADPLLPCGALVRVRNRFFEDPPPQRGNVP